MDETYRGYAIRVSCSATWDAVLIEAQSGVVLPTKATALLREGRSVALWRARALIDLYEESAARRLGAA